MIRCSRQSDVQSPARIPIAVALIGTCAITRNFVAPRPNREARRRSHPGRDWNGLGPEPLPSMPPLRLGGRGKRRRGRAAVGTPLPNFGSFACGCGRKQAVLAPRIDCTRSAPSQLPMVERDAKLGGPLDGGTAARFACLCDRIPHHGMRGRPGTVPCCDDRGILMCNLPLEFQ